MSIYRAYLETEHFEFTAYAATTTEATALLRSTFIEHIEKFGGWLRWSDVKDDAVLEFIELGKGYVR